METIRLPTFETLRHSLRVAKVFGCTYNYKPSVELNIMAILFIVWIERRMALLDSRSDPKGTGHSSIASQARIKAV